MKTKKKIWCCLFSLLWMFVLIFPVMASEIPDIPTERQKPLLVDEAGLLSEEESLKRSVRDRRMRLLLLPLILWREKQLRHTPMIIMIIMVMVMEKMMMAFYFW